MVGYDGIQPGPTFMMRKGRGKLSLLAALMCYSSYDHQKQWSDSSITVRQTYRHMYTVSTIVRHSTGGQRTMLGQVNTRTITIRTRKMHVPFGIMSGTTAQVSICHADSDQDHTEFETGENVYMGQDGFYLITDDEEQALQLPSGACDIPLSICAKQYSNNGSLVYDTNGNNGILGDVIQV